MTFREYRRDETPPRDYADTLEDDSVRHESPSTLQALADNVWLKLAERIVVPAIAFLGYQMWQDITELVKTRPITELRLQKLEDFAKSMQGRADSARAERNTQTQAILVEIAGIKTEVKNLTTTMDKIADKLDRQQTFRSQP